MNCHPKSRAENPSQGFSVHFQISPQHQQGGPSQPNKPQGKIPIRKINNTHPGQPKEGIQRIFPKPEMVLQLLHKGGGEGHPTEPCTPTAWHSTASQFFAFYSQQASPHLAMEKGKPWGSLGFEVVWTQQHSTDTLGLPLGKIPAWECRLPHGKEQAHQLLKQQVGFIWIMLKWEMIQGSTRQSWVSHLARSACRRATPFHIPSNHLCPLLLHPHAFSMEELCSMPGTPSTSLPV